MAQLSLRKIFETQTPGDITGAAFKTGPSPQRQSGLIILRQPKLKNGGMGGGGAKNKVKMKHSKLRFESKKHRKRRKIWDKMYMVYKTKEVELYGTPMCWAGVEGWKGECFGELVADHVNGRNNNNADSFINMQGMCTGHNGIKGSIRRDFRSPLMQAACVELEKERLKNEV